MTRIIYFLAFWASIFVPNLEAQASAGGGAGQEYTDLRPRPLGRVIATATREKLPEIVQAALNRKESPEKIAEILDSVVMRF